MAQALLEVGMTPADMLRVVLPLLEESALLAVVRAALADPPSMTDEAEAWEVISFFIPGLNTDDILGAQTVTQGPFA